MAYERPNAISYTAVKLGAAMLAGLVFKRRVIRNELRDAKGAFVVVANHECALDGVNLIGLCKRKMTFVLSNSFFNTLPMPRVLNTLGVIPKQQFQTTPSDMKKMKSVINAGEPLVIYPAGLMTEDGTSTPIPKGTYKFLKWLGADIYAARCTGTYFVMPKWAKGLRPGRTYIDAYKLISAEELKDTSTEKLQSLIEQALLFDAYREQDKLGEKYKKTDVIEGLENVLYICPSCGREFTMSVEGGSRLVCAECGYSETADKRGMLFNSCGFGPELRYVSDWAKEVFERTKNELRDKPNAFLEAYADIHILDYENHCFTKISEGSLRLDRNGFRIEGSRGSRRLEVEQSIANIPTLPFVPGKRIEIQKGSAIYRCVLDEGRLAMKFINYVKAFYELRNE